jgi:hypothetical protein
LSCCGDDWGDEGLIFFDNDASVYRICDNASDIMEWRAADPAEVGGVYRINTSINSLNPDNFIWNASSADIYDVVAAETGWIACDTDNSLPALYKPLGTFSDYNESCEGNTTPYCISARDSNFMCQKYVEHEEIFECRDVTNTGSDFRADGAGQEANTQDDGTGYVIGKILPNPFTEDFSEFNKPPQPDCASDFCFLMPPGNVPNSDFSMKSGFQPLISNWSAYDYIVFDLKLYEPQNIKHMQFDINNGLTNGSIFDFVVGRKGNWFHVMIPLVPARPRTVLKNSAQEEFDSITAFSLYPTACERQNTMSWTGTGCCGDDYTTMNAKLRFKTEFYNDTDANCWNSTRISNAGETIEIEGRKSILSYGGKFYSCFAPTDFSAIKDTRTNSLLVIQSNFCDVAGESGYFCSHQLTEWSNVESGTGTPGERNTTRFTPDNSSAGCCHPDDCWNGTDCIPSQIEVTGAPEGVEIADVDIETYQNFTGHRCIDGRWVESRIKWDWLDRYWGYCPQDTDCVFDTTWCAESGWYSREKTVRNKDAADLYCLDGDWTTRTKKLAENMLNIRTDDFVFDCGRPELILNAYSDATYFQETRTFANIALGKEINNICILAYDGKIVVGTTYNPFNATALEFVLSNAFNLRDFDVNNCQGNLSEDSYHDCGNGVWYNQFTESIIYDPQDEIDLDGNIFSDIYDFFIGATKMFNQLYVSKHGDKQITSVVELKWYKGKRQTITATYEGFDPKICDSVLAYDYYVANRIPEAYSPDLICNATDGEEVVVAIDNAIGPQAFAELVNQLTRKTRVE